MAKTVTINLNIRDFDIFLRLTSSFHGLTFYQTDDIRGVVDRLKESPIAEDRAVGLMVERIMDVIEVELVTCHDPQLPQ